MAMIHCPTRAAVVRLKTALAKTQDGVTLGVPVEGVDGSFLFSHPFSARDRTALDTEVKKDGGEARDGKPPDWRPRGEA